ncbi:MAG: hypothetical protein ACE5IE_00685 [Dehalococcoidia bacterium]
MSVPRPSWLLTTAEWETKLEVWSLHTKIGTVEGILRKLQLMGQALDRDTVNKIIREAELLPPALARLTPPEVQDWIKEMRPELRTVLERPPERTLAEQEAQVRHQARLLEVARRWKEEIFVPRLLDRLIEDLSKSRIFSSYARGGYEQSSEGILELYCSIERDEGTRWLFHGLCSHLDTSGRSDLVDSFEQWKATGGAYLEACLALVSEVETEAERRTGLTICSDFQTPGRTPFFAMTVCADALEYHISQGKRELVEVCAYTREPLDDPRVLWFGAYAIARGSTQELKYYEDTHSQLIAHYRGAVISGKVEEAIAKRQELEKVCSYVSEQLGKLIQSDFVRGVCELCP